MLATDFRIRLQRRPYAVVLPASLHKPGAHPQRLMEAIETGLGGVVRSKGYLWIATRPHHRGIWAQAGASLKIDPGGYWFAAVEKERWPDNPETREWIDGNWDEEVGDCRQEIVFIGVSMKRETIEKLLDDALMTKAEMDAGTEHWFTFDGPLPDWAVYYREPLEQWRSSDAHL